MNILGLSAFYHDSAAALVCDGKIIAAAQEERFTRKKHDSSFPEYALAYCLKEGKLELNDIDYVAFYDKPFLKFERLLETYLAFAPQGFTSFRLAMPIWLKEKLFQKNLLKKRFQELDINFDWENKLLFSEHHQSHAASAFYPSPFDEALVLTMDGVGEWATTSAAIGQGHKLNVIKEIHFPHSIGLLYSAFTHYLGFKVNSGEYKVMGLAPYGEPKYEKLILDNLIDVKDDGTFRLDQSFFNYCTGLTMTSDKFEDLFAAPTRQPDSEELTQHHMDLASSIQAVTEKVVLKLTRSLANETGQKNLCLAGGVALNCVANGKVLRDNKFENLWIQPAAGDAGGALGAALGAYHTFNARPRTNLEKFDSMNGSYLGPSYDQSDIEKRLVKLGAVFEVFDNQELTKKGVDALLNGNAVGWFQGRMEFGPRALGGRSILADPRCPKMQKTLNLKVKYRESFRPFAPSVRYEDAESWFDLDVSSPYMLIVSEIKEKYRLASTKKQKELFGIEKLNIPRSKVPAITHVDYSARVQTVHSDTNPLYHKLLTEFKQRSGCPILVNTSFNVRGEPIVCFPEDAFRCFMGTGIETLIIGNCYLKKDAQKTGLKTDYKDSFELD